MEIVQFQVPQKGEAPALLNMGGKDQEGNLYQADGVSLLINGKRVNQYPGYICVLEPS